MLALCVYSLAILVYQTSQPIDPSTVTILESADFFVCVIFLIDFGISLRRAPNKWRYLRTWGWLDLLSSIPTLNAARWGRAARVLRIFRVLRGLRAAKFMANVVQEKRAENALLAVSLVALMLVTFCSIAVLQFEAQPGANIQSANDALWWAVTTITTVGYGDRYPITVEGRLIAVILMSAGVGLFGTFSGLLASWFVGESGSSMNAEVAALRGEIAQLRADLTRAKMISE